MITHKQLSLADIFTDCQNKFDNDKYQFLGLLENTINFDEIVPVSFISHFHAASGGLVVAEDERNEIPAPTLQYKLDILNNATCSIIRIDTFAYRAKTDTRAVRKNVLLPAWMATLAEKRGVNCSQVLQDGLMQMFNVGHARYC